MKNKLETFSRFVNNKKSFLDLINQDILDQLFSNRVEEYKYLDLKFLSDFDLKPIDDDLNKNLIDQLDEKEKISIKKLIFENEFYSLVFINGKFFKELSNLSSSLKINPFENKDNQNSFNQKKSSENLALKNLNLAICSNSLEFNFTKNLKKPVSFIHINTNFNEKLSQKAIYTNYRITVNENVKISILDKFINYKKNDFFNNNVFDIQLDANSKVNHYILQESEDNLQFNNYKIDLKNHATYRGFLLNQKSKISRFDFEINLREAASDAQVNGIYIGKKTQFLDHYIKTNHCFDKTYSSHFLKGILKDESKASFYASTIAKKGVKKIEAKQLNKNILLDKTAVCFSKPELWIGAEDVKCSHGSTTGQLQEEAIFYLQARGFSLENAKKVLLKAFIDEIFEMVEDENIKKIFKKMI